MTPSGNAECLERNGVSARPRSRIAYHTLLVVLALAILVRLPLLQFPMGTSAGTIAYVGQRWTEGAVPYRNAFDHRPPGLYLLSGFIVRRLAPLGAAAEQGLLRLLGGRDARLIRITQGEAMPETCRAVMWVIDLAAVALVYLLVRLWCGHWEAAVAAAICAFFGGGFLVQGDCLGAKHPVSLLSVVAMMAALRSQGRRLAWLALGGLACGLAATFDYLAAFYALAIALWAATDKGESDTALRRWLLRPAVVLGATLVPMAAFAAWFWSQGAFTELWRCSVVYNVLYRWFPLAMRTPGLHWQTLRMLAPEQGALWLFAGGWAIHAFSMGFSPQTRLVAFWGLAALAAALTVRQVQAEHFLQTVPPLAIGAALAVTNPSEPFLTRDARGRLETRSLVLLLLVAGLALGFAYSEWRAWRAYASRSELNEERAAAAVADMIRDRTTRGHPIYAWGVGPQVYVLANRPAAHRIFYTRPLNVPWIVDEFFGGEGVFEEIYQTLARLEPAFFVTSEAALPDDPLRQGPMRKWFAYLSEHYEPWRMDATGPYIIYIRQDRSRLP